MSPKRLWFYSRKDYSPTHWWNRIGVPHRGDDEYGRRIVIIGTFLTGYALFAYWTCHCEDCVDLRTYADTDHRQQMEAENEAVTPELLAELEEKYGADFADEVRERQLRVRLMQEERARRV